MSKHSKFSARASLAAIGVRMRQLGIWKVIEQQVQIEQKVIKHTPLNKLLDTFINILAGGQGLVEVNTRVRPDEGVQRAFGREGCADQSTISETLNHCTDETVEQLRQALQTIYRTHSRGYQHDYDTGYQVLDVDMTGMPAGRQGEGVTKGYFAGQKNRRGRQLGRVVATLYDEIVVDRLYDGKRQLDRSLQGLVTATEDVLDLSAEQRQQTILRVDAGGGRDEDINWMLERGYQILVKVKHYKRSAKLARSVTVWYPDPKVKGREVGWVEAPQPYVKPTRQLAIRKRKHTGEWSYHVLVFTLPDQALSWLGRQPIRRRPTPDQVLFATLAAYDLRSGGAETIIKGSKQGLGLTKRNKRIFAAQEMLVLLAQLAYNLISWTHDLFAQAANKLRKFGILRMVRDAFHIPGRLELDAQGRLLQIVLCAKHPLARSFALGLAPLLARDDLSLNLGQI
ncbi:MAG: transposase [Shimia sp.]|nr:transposase [Shimia sp.]